MSNQLPGAYHVLDHSLFGRTQDGRLDGEDAEPENGHFNVFVFITQKHGPQYQNL